MRKDIYGALKNALDHGATIEQAIRSLVNAGYNDIEVREAANAITPGALATVNPNARPGNKSFPLNPILPQAAPPNQFNSYPQQRVPQRPLPNQIRPMTNQEKPKRQGTGKVIVLSITLLILLLMLAGVLLFRNKIIELLAGIL